MGAQLVCVASRDRSIRVFDLGDCMPALSIATEARANFRAGVHPTRLLLNDVQLLAGFSDGGLVVYDSESGAVLSSLEAADRACVTALWAE